ncbi:hypothetical protein [Wielerella bovis]|uniref:hypothetical protein n=1 Tax=Wielerella bovis TaxID=2917790 RepID=UPI002019863C|nr:hypothetical protein [Wielerella bovis]ULJ60879.1 hypothetical protein MIS44_03195 [Wielerella bovis]
MKPSLGMPLFLIIIGALWFLKSVDLFPSTANIIAFAIAAAGLLVLVLDGINKQSIVSAPLLMYIGAAIYAGKEEGFATSPLIALDMVFSGCLMLLARSDAVPNKRSRRLPPKD